MGATSFDLTIPMAWTIREKDISKAFCMRIMIYEWRWHDCGDARPCLVPRLGMRSLKPIILRMGSASDIQPSRAPAPRYGIIYEDISTPEDRKFWIAGSSLKVIDTTTKEVIGERIGYMMDPGQGNKSGGRSPWFIAAHHACPAFDGINPGVPQGGQTDIFVEKVLNPSPKSRSSPAD